MASTSGDFQIGLYQDVFITPEGFSRQFFKFYERQISNYQDEGKEYTHENAVADSPVIHISMDGGFNMDLAPADYVVDNDDTTFGWSPSRNDIVLPTSILNRLVVQLDAAHHRVGVCTAN
jgi:hypothetical protein